LIVLGMLAYLLDLPAEALAAPPPAGAPVVVVDDCSLTGARFAAALAGLEAREVVFAHLYSPPPLRRAIEDAEPRVRRCLAGCDLAAAAAPADAEARRAFEERWRRRLGERRYWLGASEVPVFPWSEPARPFWNPVTGRVEDCWRFAPDNLAGRGRLAPPPPRPPEPVWRPAGELVTGELDGVLWLCHTGRERVYTFAGSGAEMWRLLARWGDPELAAARLAESFAVSPAEARRDLDRFAAELAAAGLLERAGDGR
jgi:hypothetical protein